MKKIYSRDFKSHVWFPEGICLSSRFAGTHSSLEGLLRHDFNSVKFSIAWRWRCVHFYIKYNMYILYIYSYSIYIYIYLYYKSYSISTYIYIHIANISIYNMIHPILHSQLTHSMTQDSERRTKNSKPATSFFQKKMVNDLFNSQHFNPWWICFQHHQRQLCVFRGRLRAVEVATSMLQAWRARLSLAEVHVFFFPRDFF